MAEESSKKIEQVSDRGLFDFMGKKEHKPQEVVVNGIGYVHAESTEQTDENKDGSGDKKSFFDKLHRPHSSDSGSSSDEEEIGTVGDKRRKKKGLKQKIAEKLRGDKMEEGPEEEEEEKTATVTVTEQEVIVAEEYTSVENSKEEEKKGIFEKIKEKVTGHGHKKQAETTSEQESKGSDQMENDGGEKKGIFGKIMDKLPGYNKEELDSNTPPAAGH